MARPIKLIPYDLMLQLADDYAAGVPASKLIRKYKLNITHPTLLNLLRYMQALQSEQTPDEIKQIIHNSLFPSWLADIAEVTRAHTITQPTSYSYHGRMPLGEWVQAESDI